MEPSAVRRNAAKVIAVRTVRRSQMPHKGKYRNYPSTPGHKNPKRK